MVIYHYCCDGIDDQGWGCMFRSLQNAVTMLGYRVSMRGMVDAFGETWLEPPMLTTWVPPGLTSNTFLWLQPRDKDAESDMLHSTPRDYDVLLHAIGTHTRMYGAGSILRLLDVYDVAVIDNGVFAYCLYRECSGRYYILDPHTTDASKVKRELDKPVEFLEHSRCWMVIALKRQGSILCWDDKRTRLRLT